MNKILRNSIFMLLFIINLSVVRAEDGNKEKIPHWKSLDPPIKIFCTKAGRWVSTQYPKNLESINENDWESTRIGFNLQDTITAHNEDDEFFYSVKKIPGKIAVYRFPKDKFTSEPPPKNLKKYFLGKEKTIYISKEPSKTSEITDSLKSTESVFCYVFCYENEHKETEEGYWVKITTGDWTDSASIRWIYTKHLDSLDLSIPPVCLNANEVMEYPGGLRMDRVQGKVITELWIDEKGNVYKVIIKKSTHPGLNKTAEKCAYKLKFQPALKYSKKPVSVGLIFPIKYYLR